jgi:FkbM family methyltransferase
MEYWHHLHNDRWIVESVFPGLRDGYFVEAGACGGKHQSATYVLETELGWDGVCVEPADEYHPLLVRTRACATDDRCLWDKSGETVSFTQFPGDVARSGVTDVNKNLAEQRSAGAAEQSSQKRTVTLEDLLAHHGAPATIHYICLDLEGAERRVLEAFDLVGGAHRVLALSVEGDRCDDLLRDAGYRRAANPFTTERYEHYFLHPQIAARRPDLCLATD